MVRSFPTHRLIIKRMTRAIIGGRLGNSTSHTSTGPEYVYEKDEGGRVATACRISTLRFNWCDTETLQIMLLGKKVGAVGMDSITLHT